MPNQAIRGYCEQASKVAEELDNSSWPLDFVVGQMDNVFSGLIVGEPACNNLDPPLWPIWPISPSSTPSNICSAFIDYQSFEEVPLSLSAYFGDTWFQLTRCGTTTCQNESAAFPLMREKRLKLQSTFE